MRCPDADEPLIEGVDLYCGAGGLTCGLQQAGISVVAGLDVDEACRFAYETNNTAPFHSVDVRDVSGDWIKQQFTPGALTLLAGCAPCQPFSSYTNRLDTSKSSKWGLLAQFGRLIEEAQPDLVTMENVPPLARQSPFSDFTTLLRQNQYHFEYRNIDCADHGVPQTRRRLVLIGSKLGPVKFPGSSSTTNERRTVQDAIGHLARIDAGSKSAAGDPHHVSASLTELNLKRIRSSKPGGTWDDWPSDLRAACHARKSGSTYRSVYGRMCWNKPAPTITTLCFGFGNGRFGHPEQDRAISLREAALLQSFPENYVFCSQDASPAFHTVGRMIGNAVPPGLGRFIGETIRSHVATQAGTSTPSAA